MKIIRFVPTCLTMVTLIMWGVTAVAQAQVQWLDWDEAAELAKVEKKKFVVDVYTDWCGWCKKMEKATFQNPEIASYLNEHYYPIKFNAERRDDIRVNDEIYRFVRSGRGGYHQLAAKITFGKLSYPTIVFLDEDMKVIQPIAGYKDPQVFEMIIRYFGEDHHKTTPWKEYEHKYKKN